ncbi:MAG: hypothetical protein JWM96_217, partial [Alphaproteobacteria bacterium]|nr:hypothetical protein [Alphaproteobacteria bacterium]
MNSKKTSFELFIGLWNAAQNLSTPAIHKNMASWLARKSRHRRKRLLLMAFRGSGKSTLVGLFCTWLLCHNPDLRIMIVSADEALAENMLRHIRHILEKHPLAQSLLPKRKQIWASDRLLIEREMIGRDPSIRATGIHSNLTGSRADIIICDDVEVPNTSDTPLKRDKLRHALSELDFILVPDGMILYVGTPHAEDSLYKKGGFLDLYKRLEIPLDETAWPERFSFETIEQMKLAVGHRVFASQMQLMPMSLHEAHLDADLIAIYDGEIKPAASSCYWDPAFGHAAGDNSVIAYVVFDHENQAYLHDLLYLKINPQLPDDAASQQCAQVIHFLQRHAIRNIVLEGNGIGQFLPGLLRQKLKQADYPCGVQVVHNNTNKNLRILTAFEARRAAKAFAIHTRVARTNFLAEMKAFQPSVTHNNDDALDAVAGALLRHVPRYLTQNSYTM